MPAERITSLAFSGDAALLAAACWGGALFIYKHAPPQQETQTASACSAFSGLTVSAAAVEDALSHTPVIGPVIEALSTKAPSAPLYEEVGDE